MSRVEYQYDDGVKLVLMLASAEHDEKSERAYLLDLDVVAETADGFDLTDVIDRVGDLRDRERYAFEAAITPKTRLLFS